MNQPHLGETKILRSTDGTKGPYGRKTLMFFERSP